MAFSFGVGEFLAVLSKEFPQRVAIWDWSQEDLNPIASIQLDPVHGFHNYIIFNESNPYEFSTTSENQVLFFTFGPGIVDCQAPILTDDTFNEAVGKFSQTIYHTDEPFQALTATSVGKIVSWVLAERPRKAPRWFANLHPLNSKCMPNDKKPHKLFTLMESSKTKNFTILTAVPFSSIEYHAPPPPL